MKRNFFTATLLMLFCLCAMHAYSQYNPLTNSFTKMTGEEPVSPIPIDNLISYASLSGVPCIDSSFWAIASTTVDQFKIAGTVITKVGTTAITGLFDPNLAFCNNLDGGGFGPTFYSTQHYNQPVYFNGTGVTTTSTISPNKLFNCGGNGTYLYYIIYDSLFVAKAIARYNGLSLTSVYNIRSSVTLTVADLAVDIYGNVWFFTGPNNGTFQSDTLNVVTPGGHLLNQYPFTYNTLNAYGCFLLNGVLYVGLGASNTAHPNTVLPVTITSATAIAGTPVSMPVTTVYSDMASCTPGSPLFVTEHPSLQGIIVYPNPFSDNLTIRNNSNESLEIILYDITGRELLLRYFTSSTTINTEQLSRGIYIYKIKNHTGREKTGKIVKE
jgi:hypothetical protein